jgi:osmoprotectant transport system substrate-binding protein
MKLPTRLLAVAALAAAWTVPAMAKPLVVGGKNFTEQLLLAEITSQLLKKKGFQIDKRDGLGSQVVRDAQVNGQVDVYWEYTGTSLVTYNKIKDRMGSKETYDRVKELDAKIGLTWLTPSAVNNTYALAVRKKHDATDGLDSLSDLAAAFRDGKKLTIAIDAEFSGRPDGLPGLQTTYDFKTSRANIRSMDAGLTYQALRDGRVDIGLVFATDGRIKAFDFKVLKDDKEFFPNYAAAPVVRTETLKANPTLEAPLNALSAKLSDEVLRQLNARVDVDKVPVATVASEFLAEAGID